MRHAKQSKRCFPYPFRPAAPVHPGLSGTLFRKKMRISQGLYNRGYLCRGEEWPRLLLIMAAFVAESAGLSMSEEIWHPSYLRPPYNSQQVGIENILTYTRKPHTESNTQRAFQWVCMVPSSLADELLSIGLIGYSPYLIAHGVRQSCHSTLRKQLTFSPSRFPLQLRSMRTMAQSSRKTRGSS